MYRKWTLDRVRGSTRVVPQPFRPHCYDKFKDVTEKDDHFTFTYGQPRWPGTVQLPSTRMAETLTFKHRQHRWPGTAAITTYGYLPYV